MQSRGWRHWCPEDGLSTCFRASRGQGPELGEGWREAPFKIRGPALPAWALGVMREADR